MNGQIASRWTRGAAHERRRRCDAAVDALSRCFQQDLQRVPSPGRKPCKSRTKISPPEPAPERTRRVPRSPPPERGKMFRRQVGRYKVKTSDVCVCYQKSWAKANSIRLSNWGVREVNSTILCRSLPFYMQGISYVATCALRSELV